MEQVDKQHEIHTVVMGNTAKDMSIRAVHEMKKQRLVLEIKGQMRVECEI